ncbi:DUF3224 domain-containing protein [Dokdonella sp.]|uniref:DUF3224 domain-containing protein n=1 Tax=Dokdonella sp. TaxID=2291710 RepID=UPI0037830233
MASPLYARMRICVVVFALAGPLPAGATEQPATIASATDKGVPMNHRASGPFDVKIIPQKADNPQAEAAGIGRMALDKRFQGALEATSQGEMISFRTAEPTSAGYVAIERVDGTLDGRRGTFVLQHSCTMARGVATQGIKVVPDSGTGELVGLGGSMTIVIADGGAHSYVFDYTLD